jgi:hypothetical protein
MEPCPSCGEHTKMLRIGTTNSYIVVRPESYEWTDGRTWIESGCAACGHVIEQWAEPLDSPEETRPRALHL